MYEARFTTKQIYDNYAKIVSKPKNANQQAARTMKSAGIGSLGGKTTTASAKSIQDSFKEKRERRRKKRTKKKTLRKRLKSRKIKSTRRRRR